MYASERATWYMYSCTPHAGHTVKPRAATLQHARCISQRKGYPLLLAAARRPAVK
jgi:hypothetical protein